MDVFPKFIIEDGNLIISKCTYHKQLVTNKDDVRGGGWFSFKDGTFRLYGKSEDFGPAKLEDIRRAVKEDKVFTNPALLYSIAKKYKFVYDTYTKIITLN